MCELSRERLERLLTGELDPAEAELVQAHLAEECGTCDALLDELGVDEDTLTLYLTAARQAEPHPASVERMWRSLGPPRGRRWSWVFGGFAAASAAAALVVVLLPATPDPYTGVKGDTVVPRAGLGLQWVDGTTAELRYSLEREAHATVLHLREGEAPAQVYSERVAASTDGRLSTAGGNFGWSFADEPGVHLFVLVVSEAPLPEAAALTLVRDDWLRLPDGWMRAHIDGRDVGVTMVRAVVP